MAAGIDIRHRKRCTSPHSGGKCCGASWQAYVWDKRAGKLIRHTAPNKTAVRQWRQDALVAMRRGEYQQPATGRTVTAAMTELLAGMRDGTVLDRSGRRYRPATIRSYEQAWRKYLEPTLGRLRLGEVQRRDVQRLIDRMPADKLAGSTIRNKLDPLRVLYRRALEDEEVTRTPISHLRLPENVSAPRTVVDTDQAGVLLDALPDAERALFAAALYAGLRIGELRALRWTAVDFDTGVIRVHAGWMTRRASRPPRRSPGRVPCRSRDGCARSSRVTSSRPAAARRICASAAPDPVRSSGRRCAHARTGRGRPPASSLSRRTRHATAPRPIRRRAD
jgi:integrase